MRLMPPIFFLALGLFGVYCIEFGVVGILPLIIARYGISTAQAGWLVGIFALTIALLERCWCCWRRNSIANACC